jgi:hypothetical protein
VTLWPAHYEATRDQARKFAESLQGLYTINGAESMDRESRLLASRQQLLDMARPSPAARALEINGVPCRVFEPSGA